MDKKLNLFPPFILAISLLLIIFGTIVFQLKLGSLLTTLKYIGFFSSMFSLRYCIEKYSRGKLKSNKDYIITSLSLIIFLIFIFLIMNGFMQEDFTFKRLL